MRWEDIPEALNEWVEKAAAPAYDVRQAVAGVYTARPIGIYYHPTALDCFSLYVGGPYPAEKLAADVARVKAAVSRVGFVRDNLRLQELADPYGVWVKVAYSPTLRTLGEYTNFFPGQYPGGIPNHASPVASMLTAGLLGAGIGWGGGKLLSKLMPEGYGDNLGRTGMILGGMIGAFPGAAWGGTNKLTGRSFNDSTLTQGTPGDNEVLLSNAAQGSNMVMPNNATGESSGLGRYLYDVRRSGDWRKVLGKRGDDMLGQRYRNAVEGFVEKWASTFGTPDIRQPDQADVNVNALGQTLWETGASPNLAATTMGAMYAAQQLPDPNSRPGWATGNQLGQLAMNTAGNYAKGYLAGIALNTAIGTPFRASTFGMGGAALGVIGAVVPRLFGG